MSSKTQASTSDQTSAKPSASAAAAPAAEACDQNRQAATPRPGMRPGSSMLTTGDVLGLQRTIGNQAVSRLLAGQRHHAETLQPPGSAPAIQRMPSTFRVQAQSAIDLPPGDRFTSLRESPVLFGNIPNPLATPWTDFRHALVAYSQLPDAPVTDGHLKCLRKIQQALETWKKQHDVEAPSKQLNQNEQAKLNAAQQVAAALPDELQYARLQNQTRAKDKPGIVMKRLDFVFSDAMGASFLELHSDAIWHHLTRALPNFDESLLQAELEDVPDLRNLDDKAMAPLAVARADRLHPGADSNTKLALASANMVKIATMAGKKPPDFDTYVAPHSLAALQDLVHNQLAPKYPALAQDILKTVRENNLMGVNLGEFFGKVSSTYVASQPTQVNALSQQERAELQGEIRASPEYQELVQIATAVSSNQVAQQLPGKAGDLARRKDDLLKTLQFELQQQDTNGQTTAQGQPVPQEKKERIVDAVLTYEALAAKQFPRLPRFVLISKQGEKYRANADSENQFIRYDFDFEMKTAVHELGHFYENQAPLDQWYSIYLLIRSRHEQQGQHLGKDPTKVYNFSWSTGPAAEHGFLGGLQGLRDPRISEYTARYYASGHTEFMSVFSEHLINKAEMERMIDTDPQAFVVLLQVLRPQALQNWSKQRLGYH